LGVRVRGVAITVSRILQKSGKNRLKKKKTDVEGEVGRKLGPGMCGVRNWQVMEPGPNGRVGVGGSTTIQ